MVGNLIAQTVVVLTVGEVWSTLFADAWPTYFYRISTYLLLILGYWILHAFVLFPLVQFWWSSFANSWERTEVFVGGLFVVYTLLAAFCGYWIVRDVETTFLSNWQAILASQVFFVWPPLSIAASWLRARSTSTGAVAGAGWNLHRQLTRQQGRVQDAIDRLDQMP